MIIENLRHNTGDFLLQEETAHTHSFFEERAIFLPNTKPTMEAIPVMAAVITTPSIPFQIARASRQVMQTIPVAATKFLLFMLFCPTSNILSRYFYE